MKTTKIISGVYVGHRSDGLKVKVEEIYHRSWNLYTVKDNDPSYQNYIHNFKSKKAAVGFALKLNKNMWS